MKQSNSWLTSATTINNPTYTTLGNGNSSTTFVYNKFFDPLPETLLPLEATTYPFQSPMVERVEENTSMYSLKIQKPFLCELSSVNPIPVRITLVDHYDEETSQFGVYPEQLLIILIDKLEQKETMTEEEGKALRYMKYSLALLEKDILNKAS